MLFAVFLLQAGTITGEVRSPSGPLAGAQVVARSASSRMTTGTTTDARGRYALPLPPGADVRVQLVDRLHHPTRTPRVGEGKRVDRVERVA